MTCTATCRDGETQVLCETVQREKAILLSRSLLAVVETSVYRFPRLVSWLALAGAGRSLEGVLSWRGKRSAPLGRSRRASAAVRQQIVPKSPGSGLGNSIRSRYIPVYIVRLYYLFSLIILFPLTFYIFASRPPEERSGLFSYAPPASRNFSLL